MPQLVYSESPFEVFREHTPTEEMFQLLESTRWGTGKTVYQHFGNRQHFLHIRDPQIFTLRENGVLRAFTVFVPRAFPEFPNRGKAYYIRFFCAAPEVKGHGIVKRLAALVIELIRQQEGSSCFYATIEAKNPAVFKVMQGAGFVPVSRVKTLGFSRFFPKSTLEVRALSPEEVPAMRALLNQHFDKQGFWTTQNLFMPPGYFVYAPEGRILLGAQVHAGHWAIHQLPGIAGRLLPLLPHIPLIRRLFNPRSFHFMSIEGLYIHPEGAQHLSSFLESLLARHRQHTLLCWGDEQAPGTQAMLSLKNGIIHSFVKNADVLFIASFNHFPEALSTQLLEHPVYISSYDSL